AVAGEAVRVDDAQLGHPDGVLSPADQPRGRARQPGGNLTLSRRRTTSPVARLPPICSSFRNDPLVEQARPTEAPPDLLPRGVGDAADRAVVRGADQRTSAYAAGRIRLRSGRNGGRGEPQAAEARSCGQEFAAARSLADDF